MQSKNGLEFKNECMINMLAKWEGDVKIIYGRPRHPQSQGLVEQSNGTIKTMISAMMDQQKTKDWVSLLPQVMYVMNITRSSSTKFMPYEVLFNLIPNGGSKKEVKDLIQHGNCYVEVDVDIDVWSDVNFDVAAITSGHAESPEEQAVVTMKEEPESEMVVNC